MTSDLTTEQLRAARSLFDTAADLPRVQAVEWLGQATTDAQVVAYVLELLDLDANTTGELNVVTRGALIPLAQDMLEVALPEQFLDFRIVRELGRGGMGVVYEAEQSIPQRRVALKTLRSLTNGPALQEAFRTEVHALGRLQHPTIPALHALVAVGDLPVLVMALVDGQPIDAKPASKSDRLQQMIDIAQGVQHAHERGVVHRDLKPANILIDTDGTPKILDFGIASLAGSTSLSGGTPGFSAPEQLAGDAVDHRADIYSLGRLGLHLFQPAPGPLAAIFERAAAPLPDDRYASARHFSDDLDLLRKHRPTQAYNYSPTQRGALWLRRNGSNLARAGAVAVVSTLILVGGQAWLAQRAVMDRHHQAEQSYARLADHVDSSGGFDATAQADFQALVSQEAFRGAPAVSKAWRLRAAQQPDTRRSDLVSAWSTAPDASTSQAAVLALTQYMREANNWAAVQALLVHLPADVASETRDQLAIAQRAEPQGEGPNVDVVREWLAHARPTLKGGAPHATSDPLTVCGAKGVTLLNRDGTIRQRWNSRMSVSKCTSFGGDVWRYGYKGGKWPRSPPYPTDGFRIDRLHPDGRTTVVATDQPRIDTLLFGALSTASVQRFAYQWGQQVVVSELASAEGTVLDLPLAPAGRAYPTDGLITSLRGGDRQELVLASQGWGSRDVQIFGFDEAWDLLARIRISPDAIVQLPLPDGTPSLVIAGRPHAALPSHRNDRTQALLVRVVMGKASATVHSTQSLPLRAEQLHVGDLDGDGLADLASAGFGSGMLLRQLADGSFDVLALPGLPVMGISQLDDDAPLEARLWDRARNLGWLVGLRDAPPMPPLQTSSPMSVAPVPDGFVGLAAEKWRRAETLASVSLMREAVQILESLVGPSSTGKQAQMRIIELLVPVDVVLASEYAATALERADITPDERTELAAVLRSGHRFEGPRKSLLTGELANQWHVERPLSVLRRRSGVEIRAFSDHGELLRLPLHVDNNDVEIVMDLTLEEIEFAAGLQLALEAPGWSVALTVERRSGLGTRNERLVLKCDDKEHGGFPIGENRLTLRLSWSDDLARCAVQHLRQAAVAPELPSEVDLVIRTTAASQASTFLRAQLHDIQVYGATPAGRISTSPLPTSRPDPNPLTRLDALDRQLLLRSEPSLWAQALHDIDPDAFFAEYRAAWERPLSLTSPAGLECSLHPLLAGLDPSQPSERLLAITRVQALANKGWYDEALLLAKELQQAPDPGAAWEHTAAIHVALGDYPAALRAVDGWRAVSDEGEVADYLDLDERFAPLQLYSGTLDIGEAAGE